MKKYYITFGQIHTHSVNGKTLDKNTIACIQAEDYKKAHDKIFKLFGQKFYTVYDKLDDVNIEFYPKGVVDIEA